VTEQPEGLLYALALDGAGGGRHLSWEDIAQGPVEGPCWVHLHQRSPDARKWLREKSGLDPVAVEALLQEETRPRCAEHRGGLIINLRGINLNPGEAPEDMVSLRLWTDGTHIISVRIRRLMAVVDLRHRLDEGTGPASVGAFLVALNTGLVERMAPIVLDLDDDVDELEDQILVEQNLQMRSRIGQLRRRSIQYRRFIAPQRDALARLAAEPADWLGDRERMQLREIADRVTRLVEDLDAARDRAAILHEELDSRLSAQMNRNMYLLSLVAGVFLPISFVTGLLGINVGGMPGVENHWAFYIVCIVLLVLVPVEIWLFRRLKWI